MYKNVSLTVIVVGMSVMVSCEQSAPRASESMSSAVEVLNSGHFVSYRRLTIAGNERCFATQDKVLGQCDPDIDNIAHVDVVSRYVVSQIMMGTIRPEVLAPLSLETKPVVVNPVDYPSGSGIEEHIYVFSQAREQVARRTIRGFWPAKLTEKITGWQHVPLGRINGRTQLAFVEAGFFSQQEPNAAGLRYGFEVPRDFCDQQSLRDFDSNEHQKWLSILTNQFLTLEVLQYKGTQFVPTSAFRAGLNLFSGDTRIYCPDNSSPGSGGGSCGPMLDGPPGEFSDLGVTVPG